MPAHLVLLPEQLHFSLPAAGFPLAFLCVLLHTFQFQALLGVALREALQLPLQCLCLCPEGAYK